MCSILIYAREDTAGPLHPDIMASRPQLGDVADVHEDDDFFWGHEVHGERTSGASVVVKLPGVKAAEVIALAMNSSTTDGQKANRIDIKALLALHPIEQGNATVKEFDSLALAAGRIVPQFKERKIPVTFITTDKATLLAYRRTVTRRGH